jgi:hypothetical protein
VIKFSHITWRIIIIITTQKIWIILCNKIPLSRYISSRHFSPEELKPIYRPMALKGLKVCAAGPHCLTHSHGIIIIIIVFQTRVRDPVICYGLQLSFCLSILLGACCPNKGGGVCNSIGLLLSEPLDRLTEQHFLCSGLSISLILSHQSYVCRNRVYCRKVRMTVQ